MYHDHRNTVIDAAVIVVALVVIYWLIADLDLFERLHQLLGPTRETELDELIMLVLIGSVGLTAFGIRRIVDQRHEIRARQKAEDRASYLALADSLTGLPNRRQFEKSLDEMLAGLPTQKGPPIALMMIDLDRFKPVNDVFGHSIGDQVLVAFSKRAKGVLENGVLARFGGDEFAAILPPSADPDEPARIARRLLGVFDRAFEVGGARVTLGASIGLALAPANGVTTEELMRCADIALYRAKHDGRMAFRFFEPEMDAQVKRRALIEADLRQAIADGVVRPSYQPVVDLGSGQLRGFEAIPHWRHPQFGDIAPHQLIGIAEDSGMITELSSHFLRLACRDATAWPPGLMLSANLSALQLADSMLVLRVLGIVGETGLSPSRLQIEVSESALVREIDATKRALDAFHDVGIIVALDDFGSGKSSLYHLRECAFDRVKIDASFVRSMKDSPDDAAFVRAVVSLSRSLGLPVSAGGVDDQTLIDGLLADGCDEGQGSTFGTALSAEEALKLVDRRTEARQVASR
jgi:diguanylate cyclase (GGDEF)-like protein